MVKHIQYKLLLLCNISSHAAADKIPVIGVKVVGVGDPSTGLSVYTVNYGDGTCDNKYTVTKDGVTKEFTGKNNSSAD